MSKELEAFERIKKHTLSYTGDTYKTSTDSREKQAEDLGIIERALERLEGYENHTTFTIVNQINALRDENEELRKRLNEIYESRERYHLDQKKLKAFEIIIKKDVNIKALKAWHKTYKGKLSFQEYLDILEDCDLGETLIQEEFDILKEVLL